MKYTNEEITKILAERNDAIKSKKGSIKMYEIAKKAISVFGHEKQREMLVEECSELIMAIQKLKRAEGVKSKKEVKARMNNFIEEMADVSIVIMQFCGNDEKIKKKFDAFFKSKMNRLDFRINLYKKK